MTKLDSHTRQSLGVTAFESGPWASLVFSRHGEMLLANEAAERQFGQSLSILTRRRLKTAFAPDSPFLKLFLRAVETGAPLRQADVDVGFQGAAPFQAEVSLVPLPGGAVLITFYNESHGTRLERASEALHSVAGMGRTLAHEIKNPLAGIRGAAQLLKLGASPDDQPLAEVIVEEVDRIRRLVDQVEAFSADQPCARGPVNIHQVLDRVRTLVSSSVGDAVGFRSDYDPSLPPVLGDQDQLVQIFLNLAKNAAEAALDRADGRGEVVIATAYRAGARVRPASKGSLGAPLEVRVQDNGPGVAPDLRHRLFDAFVSSKDRGMGLGLTLVAKLVKAHEGLIEFESEPGRTIFHVLLPIAQTSPMTEA